MRLLEKYGSFIKNFTEKEKKPGEQKAGQKEKAHAARKGNARVCNEFDRIELKDKTGTIKEETLQSYKEIIDGLKLKMDNAPTIVSDTERIDDSLIEIISCVKDSITNGHPGTVKILLGYLETGIGDIRNEIDKFDEFKRAQGQSKLEKFKFIAMGMVSCDEIEDKIKEKDVSIERKKQELKEAHRDFKESFEEYEKINPNAREDIIIVPGTKGPLDGQLMSLIVKKGTVVELYNKVQELYQLKAFNEATLQSQRNALDTLKIEFETTDNLLGEEFMEQIKSYHDQFESALYKIRENNEKLGELTDEFDTMLQVFFSNGNLKKQAAVINAQYEKIVAEMKRREEAIQNAKEQKQKKEQSVRTEQVKQVNG